MNTNLKSSLKNIRSKIDAGLYTDALQLIQKELDSNTKDYTLFLFAGFVNYTLRNFREAAKTYRMAIDYDPIPIRAWQGLFNVYSDDEWSNFEDDFGLQVCEHLLKQSPPADKIPVYEKIKLKFLVHLKKIDTILNEWDVLSNSINAQLTVKLLKNLYPKNSDHRKLSLLLLERIQFSDVLNEDEHATICKAHEMLSNDEQNVRWAIDHVRKFVSHGCQHVAIISKVFCVIRRSLLSFYSPDADVRELMGVCAKLSTLTSIGYDELCREILADLHAKNYNSAYERLTNVEQTLIMDNCLLFAMQLYVYRQLGQYHKISFILDNYGKLDDTAKTPELLYLKLEADFVLAETSSDFRLLLQDLSKLGELPDLLKCVQIQCRILLDLIDSVDGLNALLNAVFAESRRDDVVFFVKHFCRALYHLHVFTAENNAKTTNATSGGLELARNEIRQAAQLLGPFARRLPLSVCNVTAINARIAAARGQLQLATSQLVNAVQTDAYSAENFRLLAEYLFNSGVSDKAKLCAERAKLLNPKSEITAKLLHRIYSIESENDTAKTTKIFSELLEFRPNSKWALRNYAIADLNEGRFETAIEKIQRLVRLSTTNEEMSQAQRNEICTLWLFLSEAYRQCGNLQSAVRVSKAVLELYANHVTASIQLIQLYQSMGQYDSALELGDSLLARADTLESGFRQYLKVMHAHSLILHASEDGRLVSDQHAKLKQLFPILRELLVSDERSALLQKIVAKAFSILLSYNSAHFSNCLTDYDLCDNFWRIISKQDAIERRLQCLARILKQNPKSSNTWEELANTFLFQFQLNEDQKCLEQASFCIRKALNLTSSKFKISGFYCTLGKCYIFGRNAKMAQHCFIRAIHLDRRNANAWCFLALLYLKCGLLDEAFKAMSQAQKINPQLMEAWCGQAMHAEATNDYDTMDLYRHTIFLKPTALAVKKYSYFLAKCIREKRVHEDGAMLDFNVIKDLTYKIDMSNDFAHAMALLAEQFWHFDDAKDYIRKVKEDTIGVDLNRTRILIKNMDLSALSYDEVEPLNSLQKLYRMPLPKLFDTLQRHPTMKKLFAAIRNVNLSEFSAVYRANFYPLIVSACIFFDLTIDQTLFGIVENVRPLHKLVDVYPLAGICRSEFYTVQQQDVEEKILVRHDYLSEKLYNILSSLGVTNNDSPNLTN